MTLKYNSFSFVSQKQKISVKDLKYFSLICDESIWCKSFSNSWPIWNFFTIHKSFQMWPAYIFFSFVRSSAIYCKCGLKIIPQNTNTQYVKTIWCKEEKKSKISNMFMILYIYPYKKMQGKWSDFPPILAKSTYRLCVLTQMIVKEQPLLT